MFTRSNTITQSFSCLCWRSYVMSHDCFWAVKFHILHRKYIMASLSCNCHQVTLKSRKKPNNVAVLFHFPLNHSVVQLISNQVFCQLSFPFIHSRIYKSITVFFFFNYFTFQLLKAEKLTNYQCKWKCQ